MRKPIQPIQPNRPVLDLPPLSEREQVHPPARQPVVEGTLDKVVSCESRLARASTSIRVDVVRPGPERVSKEPGLPTDLRADRGPSTRHSDPDRRLVGLVRIRSIRCRVLIDSQAQVIGRHHTTTFLDPALFGNWCLRCHRIRRRVLVWRG